MKRPWVKGSHKCPCCGQGDLHPLLIAALVALASITGWRIYLNSGCRCVKHNKEVKGSPGSQHLLLNGCRGADIWSPDAPPWMISLAMLEVSVMVSGVEIFPFRDGGIGIYATHAHGDVRPYKARWAFYPDGETRLPFDEAPGYYGGKEMT